MHSYTALHACRTQALSAEVRCKGLQTHQQHGDADLQEDPDDDDDVAVDEDRNDHIERAVVGVHSNEAVELGGATG